MKFAILLCLVTLALGVTAQRNYVTLKNVYYTDEIRGTNQGYSSFVFVACQTGVHTLSVNVHSQAALGISLFAYGNDRPNPTSCNYKDGWTTEQPRSTVPKDGFDFYAEEGTHYYFGFTCALSTKFASFGASIVYKGANRTLLNEEGHISETTRMLMAKHDPEPELIDAMRKVEDCDYDYYDAYPLYQGFVTVPGTVKYDEQKFYHLDICTGQMPQAGRATLTTAFSGRPGAVAFNSFMSDIADFEPPFDTIGSDIDKQAYSEIKYSHASGRGFPEDIYLSVQGWGGYYNSQLNRFLLSARLTYSE